MSRIFTVQLSKEELTALSVFKPNLTIILNNYYDSYNKYIDRLGKLFGYLGYLSEHNYTAHLSKLESLRNLIYEYFFDEDTKKFISEFEITDKSKYCKFISKLDMIVKFYDYLIVDQNYAEDVIKESFAEDLADLKVLIYN